jgi:two-component system response regulator AtoC
MEFAMKPSLLIAEGDTELRELYGKFLAERSYNVATAADGLECLEKLRRLRPEVLVLDRDLRWGGGDGVLACLREGGAVSSVAVVLTTTAGPLPDVVEDIEPPVVRFLHKPFPLMTLLETVRAAVARKGAAGPFHLDRGPTCSELFIG